MVLPYIDMNQPWVYMCSPSWAPLPLPLDSIPFKPWLSFLFQIQPVISVEEYVYTHMCYSLSHVWLFVTPWTTACQAPLSREFSKQEYRRIGWFSMPSSNGSSQPRELNPGLPHSRWTLDCQSHQGSPSFILEGPYQTPQDIVTAHCTNDIMLTQCREKQSVRFPFFKHAARRRMRKERL